MLPPGHFVLPMLTSDFSPHLSSFICDYCETYVNR